MKGNVAAPVTKTLYELLKEYSKECPDKPLFMEEEEMFSVAQILHMVDERAAWMQNLGIKQGMIVTVRMERNAESICFLFALMAIGAVAYTVDSHVNVLDFFCVANKDRSEKYITGENGKWTVVSHNGLDAVFEPVSCCFKESGDAKAPSVMICTSGSEGDFKLVLHSQYSIINNLTDAGYFGDYCLDDIALGILPLSHIFGLVLVVGAVVLRYAVAFPKGTDADDVLEFIEKKRITRINSVPSYYLNLASRAIWHDVSSLRVGFIGGAPCTKSEFGRIEEGLGIRLIPVYGMSECPSITIAEADDPACVRNSGVGRKYNYSTVIITDEKGNEVIAGTEGEVCVSGESLMIGYVNDGKIIETSGFFKTGDLGFFDETGVLHLTGRIKEIIIRNGNNISLRKIEEAVLSVKGVREAAAVGVKDSICGEVPVVFVTGEAGSEIILREIAGKLKKNELPSRIITLASIPKTGSGKNDKQNLISSLNIL